MTREEAFDMLDRMAKGIAEMFGSNCETVINDLTDPLHPILAIYNGHVSGRSVGSTQDVTGVEQDLHLDTDVVNLLAAAGVKPEDVVKTMLDHAYEALLSGFSRKKRMELLADGGKERSGCEEDSAAGG